MNGEARQLFRQERRKLRIGFSLCLLAASFLHVSPTCPAQEKSQSKAKVAVVASLHTATGKPEDARLGELAGELLAVAIADRKNVVVVERRRLAEVLKEQKLGLSGLVDPATAARVGKLLTADIVVAGSIVESEGNLRYAVNVIAVEGRSVLGSVQLDGNRKDFERISLELARKVAAIAGVEIPEITPEELDDSPVGRLHLMRGISFYYANNPDQAIAYCLRAVHLDPRLQDARLWIARAYLSRDERAHARAELERLARNPTAKQLAEQVKQLLVRCNAPPAAKSKSSARKE